MTLESQLRIVAILVSALMCGSTLVSAMGTGYGLETTKQIKLHFRFAKSVVDSGYMNNAASLQKLDRLLTDKNEKIDSVVIIASGSPEGVVEYNQALAARRAKAVEGYIIWKYPHVNQHLIFTRSIGEDWEGLRQLVANGNAPYKEQILKTISQEINPSTKEWRLKQIDGGRAWSYITNHYLRYLRAATIGVVYYTKQEVEKPADQPIEPSVALFQEIDIIECEKTIEDTPTVVEQTVEQPIVSQVELLKKPLFALKTNLLFDAITALNIELEIPISTRWSIAGEYIFPWWLSDKKQNCFQVVSGSLEVRYWFRPNYKKQDPASKNHNPLTGWFVGLYGGGGYYDLERNGKGYQGEFFIAMGISGGYVQPLSRNLSMEFSVGVGSLKTDYRQYDAKLSNIDNQWHLIRQQNGSYSWFGPTKAKIALVWYPHFKSKKGGRK